MKHVVLLGAGFSHNWGGRLASEVFGFLIGCRSVDTDIKQLLSRHEDTDGFEGALDELQTDYLKNRSDESFARLQKLQDAITEMFDDMDRNYSERNFEFQQERARQLQPFLARFDAIFSLNQDQLLERHYLNGNIELSSPRRWDGGAIPGMKKISESHPNPLEENICNWRPSEDRTLSTRIQPIFKLHGSSNWMSDDGGQLMVLGRRKADQIQQHDILRWYYEIFHGYLSSDNVRLMVIGYSFGDPHINTAIVDGAADNSLKLFVVDPAGRNVTESISDEARNAGTSVEEFLVGVSTHALTKTFGNDFANHEQLTRFFSVPDAY